MELPVVNVFYFSDPVLIIKGWIHKRSCCGSVRWFPAFTSKMRSRCPRSSSIHFVNATLSKSRVIQHTLFVSISTLSSRQKDRSVFNVVPHFIFILYWMKRGHVKNTPTPPFFIVGFFKSLPAEGWKEMFQFRTETCSGCLCPFRRHIKTMRRGQRQLTSDVPLSKVMAKLADVQRKDKIKQQSCSSLQLFVMNQWQ